MKSVPRISESNANRDAKSNGQRAATRKRGRRQERSESASIVVAGPVRVGTAQEARGSAAQAGRACCRNRSAIITRQGGETASIVVGPAHGARIAEPESHDRAQSLWRTLHASRIRVGVAAERMPSRCRLRIQPRVWRSGRLLCRSFASVLVLSLALTVTVTVTVIMMVNGRGHGRYGPTRIPKLR